MNDYNRIIYKIILMTYREIWNNRNIEKALCSATRQIKLEGL